MLFETTMARIRILYALDELNGGLRALGPVPHNWRLYDYGVEFFNCMVVFNKQCKFDVALFPESPAVAKKLQNYLDDIAECQKKWVHAQPGDKVTLENLYLGDIAGIHARPAIRFKRTQNREYDQLHIRYQLRTFLEANMSPLIDLSGRFVERITRLESFLIWLNRNCYAR